jgi:hypothetical protein
VPLPAGREWKIDDHSTPELVLRHPPTRSTIVVAVLRSDGLVGRTQCEQLATENRLLPKGDVHVLEDQVTTMLDHYDTRVRVGLAPGPRPESPLAGYVVAFGGFLRKCFVFTFATEVDRAEDESVLSSRLAVARTRILDGLKLDAFGTVPRETPTGPASP